MYRLRLLLAGVSALAVATPALAVTGGTLDGSAHSAVGLVLADRGNGFEPDCSGSLVSPTVLVTAAHCASGLSSSRVQVTFDPRYVAGSSALLSGTINADPAWGTDKNDSHDVAVVVLDRPANVAPLALPREGALDAGGLKAQSFTNVGYGLTDAGASFDGYRRVSSSSYTSLKPTELKLSESSGGVCFGDSGGPRLLDDVVVAVTSTGNANCTGQSTSYRLDSPSARAFLAAYVALP